jgi:aminopeptidase N
LVVPNDGDLDYAIVRFDRRSLRTLTESIGDVTDPLARAVCWNAAIDMVRQAELPLPDFVRMLANGMDRESSVSVLQTLSSVTEQIMTLAGDPHWVAQGKQELAAAGTRLLRAAEPGSDHQLAYAQLLSWTATATDQLGLLAALLDGGAQLPGLTIDAELRWAILRRLATTGRAGDAEIDAELQRDAADAGRRHRAACRAAVPDAEHKAAAWKLLTETDDLGNQGIAEVARGLIQPEHAGLLAPYVERYFAVLPAIWSTRGEHTRVRLSELLFPHPASSLELLTMIDAFLATGELDHGLVRVLTERRDIVTAALRSRALAPLS